MRMMTMSLLGIAVTLSTTAALARPATPVDVAIQTTVGTIVVRLDPAHAPNTTKNFLHYVDVGTYDGTMFYRSVSKAREPQSNIEVIQGGINPQQPNPMIRPIPLEPTNKTGLHNTDGTIAMARTSDPNSANSQFFFNLANNSASLDSTNNSGGFTVFGHTLRDTPIFTCTRQTIESTLEMI